MRNPCLNRHCAVALVHHPPHKGIAMNRKEHNPSQQTSLALGSGVHWEQLPRDVRDRCRALVAQLLMSLVRSQPAGGDDDER